MSVSQVVFEACVALTVEVAVPAVPHVPSALRHRILVITVAVSQVYFNSASRRIAETRIKHEAACETVAIERIEWPFT